jgi:oligoendopeptidase F
MIILKRSNLFYKKTTAIRNIVVVALILLIFVCLGCYFIFSKVDYEDNTFNNVFGDKMKNEKNLPLWNLNDLYKGIDDENIDKDIENIENKINDFVKYYKNNIKYLSSSEFLTFLKEYEKINELMGKVGSYASLKHAENLNEENAIFYQTIDEKLNNLQSRLIFVSLEINKLKESDVEEKLKGNRILIKNYAYFLKVLRRYKKYQMEEILERAFTEKSLTSREAWVRLFDETINNMEYVFEGKKLNEAQLLEIINNHKNDKTRQEAGKLFGKELGKNIKLFAFITNTLAKEKSINDKWRGFKTPIASRNLANGIDDVDVESLYNSVINNYKNISHRYYNLKAKILKKDKLLYTDRNAPLPFDNSKKYSWEEAKTIVLDAYYNFSPKMAEIGRLFFDNNWIDVPTRQGKRGGAFASPTVPSVHSYILLNFTGTQRDVMTLAHELGHGIHMYLSRNQNYLNYDTPLTLAETASIFGEQLIFRYLLEKEATVDGKMAIIANKIEDMINTVVRQIAFLEFEKTVHDERKDKEIAVERLNEIWLNVQKKSLGDIFEFSDEYKYYWTYIPHFIHTPFYVYSYSFGDCLVNTLYSQYVASTDKEKFVKKYLSLLEAGGSEDYTELLKEFGLNPKDKDFWDNGMKVIIELINELENMTKAHMVQ